LHAQGGNQFRIAATGCDQIGVDGISGCRFKQKERSRSDNCKHRDHAEQTASDE
jgi:hypothetical protein